MGAKFSSGGGATVFYDDGPITAPSGEQGTQRTEFEAAIKSVTSSETVGAVFVYDTRNDSDGGAWRKKTSHTSWAREAASDTRSARSEFPSVALIVADNSATSNVTIYDLDDPAMPMWMVINRGAGHILFASGMGSVFALNGRLYVGHSTAPGALSEISFVDDYGFVRINSTTAYNGATIADREVRTSDTATGTTGALVNRIVNDVSATIVEGAEIGALGLPIPTAAIATANGISIILPSGTVNSSNTGVSYSKVAFDSKSRLWRVQPNSNSTWMSFDEKSVFFTTSFSAGQTVTQSTHASASLFTPNYLGDVTAIATTSGDNLAVGTDEALNHYLFNPQNIDDSAVAFVTSSYNTGYMLGDIRFAGLANAASADRSVKGNTLNHNGSVSNADVATNAELQAYSGFSASNYLSRSSDTDFDFDTGDFSIMFWVKDSNAGQAQNFISRSDASAAEGDWLIQSQSDGSIDFYLHSGSGWILDASTSSPATPRSSAAGVIIANQWTQVVAVKRSSKFYWYINGELSGTPRTDANSFTPSGGSDLTIGHSLGNNNPADNSSLSLLRISTTAPTPQQVKDIYEAEAPLFRSGAKCLLQSDDSSASDRNVVMDLAYDKSTDLLHVFQKGDAVGENLFRGLEVVESRGRKSNGWTYSSASYGAAAGGVSASARVFSGGGVIVDLPAIDVRGDINTADTKLPDDGKFHFSGVTDDGVSATPTVIGNIPIAENERYKVSLIASGETWPPQAGHWIDVTMEETFFRKVGDNVVARGEASKLTNESLASMDIDLVVDTDANTIQVQVTGVASTRVAWNATVEVQRVASEKTYER